MNRDPDVEALLPKSRTTIARAIAEQLTDNQWEALRSIWPATDNIELSWPRWVSRADINAIEQMGLISETDRTDLGRAVLKLHPTLKASRRITG